MRYILTLRAILNPFWSSYIKKWQKINFIWWHVIYHWKAESVSFKNMKCFLLRDHLGLILKPFWSSYIKNDKKINFFISWHGIYHWKAENLCFKILSLFLDLKVILKVIFISTHVIYHLKLKTLIEDIILVQKSPQNGVIGVYYKNRPKMGWFDKESYVSYTLQGMKHIQFKLVQTQCWC